MLRPEVYRQYEEYLKVLHADILTDVRNGRDLENARKAAYEQIYQSVNPSFNYDKQFLLDICYHNIPVVDAAMFTVAVFHSQSLLCNCNIIPAAVPC